MGNGHVSWARDRAHGLGLGLFLYKALALGFPVLAGEKSDLRDVEARVKFSARGRAVKVSLSSRPAPGGSRSSCWARCWEQSVDLDTLVAQLVKRLAAPKPDSNVAAGGPSPG